MKNYYTISIPKPCHEDWNSMSPKEKGRFCNSCAKTVIDFSKMEIQNIQDFIHLNKHKNICGRFKQTQLDSINLIIPSQVINQHYSFHKLFLLVLLITMGTSLMNCTNKNGNKQKIESVKIIDSTKTTPLKENSIINKTDSLTKKSCTKDTAINFLEIETVGEIQITPNLSKVSDQPIEIDSLDVLDPPEKNNIDNIIFGIPSIDSIITPPEFKNTPQSLSLKEKKEYFSKQVNTIVSKNFNTSVCLELKGKQRLNVQFKIDSSGFVRDIKAEIPHPKLEAEAKRVIKQLPQLIPATHKREPCTFVYSLPIIIQIE